MLHYELVLAIFIHVLIHYVTAESSFKKETGQLLWSVLYWTGKKEEKHVEVLVELKPTHRCWDIYRFSDGLSFNTEASGYRVKVGGLWT